MVRPIRTALFTLVLAGCGSAADSIPDADGDGTADPHDCAPDDPAIHLDAPELCNEVDDNCDGQVDEGVKIDTWPDLDGDGHGHGSAPRSGCPMNGWSDLDDDCDDKDASIHPGAEDTCNGVDDNCDGVKDAADTTWFADADGDTYGDDTTAVATCSPPAGYVVTGGDCDDSDAAIHPGATELCNALDDDCDGTADLGYETTWYSDADGDGHGSPLGSQTTCAPPSGWVLTGDDCRPSEATAYPGAPEACNTIDDDCDGAVDEGFDVDGDGHYDEVCSFGDDCDDRDDTVYTAAPEVCGDGLDQDCDSLDLHCGYEGTYDLTYADVRATNSEAVSTAGHVDHGDFDGDGNEDLLFNAISASAAVIVHGPLSGAVDLSTAATYFQGDGSAIYGARSIGVGDVNGDGLDDVGFGAPYGGNEGLFILNGPADTDTEASNADVSLTAVENTYAGHGAEISDVTGDGIADGIVGAYSAQYHGGTGLTYVWNGPLEGDYDLDDVDSFIYDSTGAGYAGRWERSDGDINGDGVNDLLIAAPWASGGAFYSGLVYVVLGPPDASLDLASADARILGTTASGYLGEYRTLKFGDADGDGVDDTMVGAYSVGEVGIFYGALSGDVDFNTADVSFAGSTYFGSGLDLNDIDGNGAVDVLISNMNGTSGGGPYSGATYLYWDVPAGAYADTDADATFYGESAAYAGATSCFADMDSDGWLDVVIGAQSLDVNGGFYVEYQVR